MVPKILNPLVDALALVEAQNKFSITQYLNAFDVEDYIISKGAFHMDQDVVYLRMSDDDQLSKKEWEGSPTQYYRTTRLEKTSGYVTTLAQDSVPGFGVSSNSVSAEQAFSGDWSGILDFDNMLEEEYFTETRTDTSIQTPPVVNRVRTLSVPILLQTLAKRAS